LAKIGFYELKFKAISDVSGSPREVMKTKGDELLCENLRGENAREFGSEGRTTI